MADIVFTESDEVTIADAAGVNKLTVSVPGEASVQTLDVASNFTFNAVSQSATISTTGKASLVVYSIGTWVGSISFLASVDGSTFFNITGTASNGNTVNGFTVNSSTPILISCAGYVSVRITSFAWTSGTAVVYWNVSARNNFNPFTVVRMEDFSGNGLTSQANGAQRALDVGIDVAGVQIDPRQTRALTSSDTVTVVQPTGTNLHTVVDSSTLPTGAATSALQTTGNTSVASIDTKIATLGQKTMAGSSPVVIASDQSNVPVVLAPNVLGVTATAAAGTAVTLTLPAVAGQFHYIDRVRIQMYSTAARTGSATPVLVTTTNIPGTPVWDFPTATAIGTITDIQIDCSAPIKSSVVNTATTIVCPATTSVIWRVIGFYYTAA
jgi:hypothetical protein